MCQAYYNQVLLLFTKKWTRKFKKSQLTFIYLKFVNVFQICTVVLNVSDDEKKIKYFDSIYSYDNFNKKLDIVLTIKKYLPSKDEFSFVLKINRKIEKKSTSYLLGMWIAISQNLSLYNFLSFSTLRVFKVR